MKGWEICLSRVYLVLLVLDSILPHELDLNELQQLLRIRYAVEHRAQVRQRPVVVDAGQRGEGVPLAGGVALGLEEGGDQVGGVGDHGRRVLEDGCRGEDGVLADVGVAVLEAGSRGGQEGFYELGLAELGEEAEGVSADVLVRVLEVIPDAVAGSGPSRVSTIWKFLPPPLVLKEVPPRYQEQTHQTRIISCLSFPLESTLGHIS